MEMFILVVLPGMVSASAVTFSHSNQGTSDITTVTIEPSNVEEATLNNNEFGVAGIPATFFQNFPDLKKLSLAINQLDDLDVPDFCFAGVGSSLTELGLSTNLLHVIRRDQLSGLHLLEKLSLTGNEIHTIEAGKGHLTLITRKQTLGSLSLSYQKAAPILLLA